MRQTSARQRLYSREDRVGSSDFPLKFTGPSKAVLPTRPILLH